VPLAGTVPAKASLYRRPSGPVGEGGAFAVAHQTGVVVTADALIIPREVGDLAVRQLRETRATRLRRTRCSKADMGTQPASRKGRRSVPSHERISFADARCRNRREHRRSRPPQCIV